MTKLFTGELRKLARNQAAYTRKSADGVLREAVTAAASKSYDVFLSHSFSDAELILGTKLKLESLGYSVYVDWLEDTQMSRQAVTEATARVLRGRMMQSASLLFATTDNSSKSKWMPWELGFKDAHNGKVAILPLSDSNNDGSRFEGQEYLGIYPSCGEQQGNDHKQHLWIYKRGEPKPIWFKRWLTE